MQIIRCMLRHACVSYVFKFFFTPTRTGASHVYMCDPMCLTTWPALVLAPRQVAWTSGQASVGCEWWACHPCHRFTCLLTYQARLAYGSVFVCKQSMWKSRVQTCCVQTCVSCHANRNACVSAMMSRCRHWLKALLCSCERNSSTHLPTGATRKAQ